MLGFDLRKAAANNRFQRQFQDLGQIGSGGFSVVHKVKHRIDQRNYAAKIISIKPSHNSDDNEERLYRFLAEPKAQASLLHPNIITYHGCWIELVPYSEQEIKLLAEEHSAQNAQQSQFQMILLDGSNSSDDICFGKVSSESERKDLKIDNDKPALNKIGDGTSLKDYKEIKIYLLSQLCEQNLQSFIANRNLFRRQAKLTAKEVLENYKLILEMVAGLNYLHSKRIIHRDIKLHNVMITSNHQIKIIDFGLAKRVKYWKTSIEDTYQDKQRSEQDQIFSTSVGTRLFSSPQQANSQKYDYRTDIYSLAMIICLLFSRYSTVHQQRDLLDKIRKRNLEEIEILCPLKELVFRSLGSENERPSLSELQKCLKQSMKSLKVSQIENLKFVEQNERTTEITVKE